MSNNRDLLKEAIADAKAVKETAIANAKAALEEAFTPHLKSMLAAKLEEMDKDDVDEGYDKYEEDDMQEAMDSKYEEDDMKEGMEEKEVDEEVNLDELLAELDETEEVTESEEIDEAKKDDKDEVKEAKKEEVKESEEIEESEEVTEEEEVEDKMEIDVEDEEAQVAPEDETLDIEDMTEDDLKDYIEKVIVKMVEDGELEAGEEFEASSEEEIEVEDDTEDTMTEETEETLEEMDEVSWNEKNNPTRGASKKELDPKKVGKSTSAYAVNLEEAMAEVEELKKELQEVNLLNAKLLYTNKIFKSKNLSEDKKLKVLKAFDNASTVKEAKVVFETLNEGIVETTKKLVNEVKGSASKATGTAPAAKQPIVESDAMVERFKKLAGII